jgi:hypothetical protein
MQKGHIRTAKLILSFFLKRIFKKKRDYKLDLID